MKGLPYASPAGGVTSIRPGASYDDSRIVPVTSRAPKFVISHTMFAPTQYSALDVAVAPDDIAPCGQLPLLSNLSYLPL